MMCQQSAVLKIITSVTSPVRSATQPGIKTKTVVPKTGCNVQTGKQPKQSQEFKKEKVVKRQIVSNK